MVRVRGLFDETTLSDLLADNDWPLWTKDVVAKAVLDYFVAMRGQWADADRVFAQVMSKLYLDLERVTDSYLGRHSVEDLESDPEFGPSWLPRLENSGDQLNAEFKLFLNTLLPQLSRPLQGAEEREDFYPPNMPLPPPQPLSLATFDGRYFIDCGNDHFVFDCDNGVGQAPNNANIRYMGFGAVMPPRTFLQLCAPLPSEFDDRSSNAYMMDRHNNIGWGPPTLYVNYDKLTISGHEGRHRSRLFQHFCGQPFLVHVILQYEIRARDITDAMLHRVRAGLHSERTSSSGGYFVRGPLFNVAFLRDQTYRF